MSMPVLATITGQDFIDGGSGVYEDTEDLFVRQAARAVLLNDAGHVFLMHVGLHGYHKLPGGGIDPGETPQQAMLREVQEEVGCDAEIIHELGMITEYRLNQWTNDRKMKQVSYCYLARQVGEQRASALEQAEIDEQLVQVMADSIEHAIALLEADQPDNLEGRYIQKRDLAFLRAALQADSAV